MDSAPSTITECQWCRKVKSPTQRIRACTRCLSVGYCSISCQKADWKETGGGHKARCNKPSTNLNSRNSTTVRLEVKRSDEDRWDDVGQINLVEVIASDSLYPVNTTLSGHHRETNLTTGCSEKSKELPIETRRLLGQQQSANTYKYQHSHDGVDENLLIFFHGAGDSHMPYAALGQKMELPQTAILSLGASLSINLSYISREPDISSGFVKLPFDLGHTWFEEMDYELTGETLPREHPRRIESMKHAIELLELILCSLTGLNEGNHESNSISTSWIPERIFLFGFSAGGSLAMEMCRMWLKAGRLPLGGAICVAGGIQTQMKQLDISSSCRQKNPTDLLIITGEKDEIFPKEAALASMHLYHPSHVQLHVQKGKGHSMVANEDEMRVIMEFLSKRLGRRLVSMESRCR